MVDSADLDRQDAHDVFMPRRQVEALERRIPDVRFAASFSPRDAQFDGAGQNRVLLVEKH